MKQIRTFLRIPALVIVSTLFISCGVTIDFGGGQEDPEPTAAILLPTETTEPAPSLATGSISGSLSYPSEFIPPLRVVAFRLENGQPSGDFRFVETTENQGDYQLDGLAAGLYWVVAYTIPVDQNTPQGLAAGYSQAVPCGLAVECDDHSLVVVAVQEGLVTENIDPNDWYAPNGTFPDDPLLK